MRVSIDAALLRDRNEGKVIRGEMAEELRNSVQPLTAEEDAYVRRRIKQEKPFQAALDASNALQELAGAYNQLREVELATLRANGFVVTPETNTEKPFGANQAKYQKHPFSSVQADIQDGVLEEAVRLFQGRLAISDYRLAVHRRDAFFGPFCECTRHADL